MQDSFKAEADDESGCLNAAAGEGSSSRYAEPEAEGVRPVLRTRTNIRIRTRGSLADKSCRPYRSFWSHLAALCG